MIGTLDHVKQVFDGVVLYVLVIQLDPLYFITLIRLINKDQIKVFDIGA